MRHILSLNLLGYISKVADVDTILVEEIAQRLRIGRDILRLCEALDQGSRRCFLEESGQGLYFVLLHFDLILRHGELDILEDVGVEYFLVEVFDEALKVLLPALIELHYQLLILFLLLIRHLLTLFHFWRSLILLLLQKLVCLFHHLFGVIDALLSIVDRDQLMPQQAGVVLVAHVICVSWRHALQVHDVAPLISSSDSLDLHATRNFNRFTLCIKYFVDLNTQFARYFLHQCMELLVGLDRLLLIDRSVLCQARQLAVVEDAWNDALSNYSVTSVVDDCSRDVMQAIDLEHLQLPEAREIMIGLCPTWVLIRLRHVFEVVV